MCQMRYHYQEDITKVERILSILSDPCLKAFIGEILDYCHLDFFFNHLRKDQHTKIYTSDMLNVNLFIIIED